MAALIRPSLTVRTFPRRLIDLGQAETPARAPGLTTVILQSGDAVEISEIATAEEGRSVLDEIDSSILSIEAQLADFQGDPEWRKRAARALKVRKLQRPRVQERIGQLRVVEKNRSHANHMAANSLKVDAKRGAFVKAAYELLGHERCADVWARAQAISPEAFDEGDR